MTNKEYYAHPIAGIDSPCTIGIGGATQCPDAGKFYKAGPCKGVAARDQEASK